MKIASILRHKLFRSSAIVLIGSMAANVSGWLYHLAVGRILGPAKYAELSALLALFFILNVFSGVFQMSLVKFFSILKARNEFGEAKTLFYVMTKKIVLFTGIGFFILIPFVPVVGTFLNIHSSIYYLWIYLIFATTTVSVVSMSFLQGFQKFFDGSVYANIGMFLRLITGVIFAFFGVGWTLFATVLSNILGYISYFIPIRFLFRYKAKPLTITKKQAVTYAIPVLLTTLGLTALNTQDILLVKHYFSSFDAGIYSSLTVLGKVIFYASSAVGFVLFPLVAEKNELKGQYDQPVWLGLLAVGGLSLLVTIGYFLFPTIVILPFGPAFAGATPYLGLFGIFVTFYTMANLLIYVLMALEKAFVWIFTIASAILQIMLISFFHQTIYQIVWTNITVSAMMFFILMLYYAYVTKRA